VGPLNGGLAIDGVRSLFNRVGNNRLGKNRIGKRFRRVRNRRGLLGLDDFLFLLCRSLFFQLKDFVLGAKDAFDQGQQAIVGFVCFSHFDLFPTSIAAACRHKSAFGKHYVNGTPF
jgi:hypothetical protein